MAFEIKEVAVQGSQAVVEVSQALKELAKEFSFLLDLEKIEK
jgi:hypothetical protein